jgi:hypothetical protein
MKKTIIILLILIIALSLGCTQNKPLNPLDTTPSNSCGNNVCELNEDCQSCTQDCGCKNNQYCETQAKVCKTPTCGNGIIEQGETQENCCSDVACSTNLICNKSNQTCMTKTNSSDSDIQQVVSKYLTDNNLTAKITSITDAYYASEITKKVILDCKTTDYPCAITIYVDTNMKIIDEIRTS